MAMSATEELRELEQMKKAYEAEISCCLTYLHNEERWRNELAREEKRLADQQARVDRLRARAGEAGEATLQKWRAKLEANRARYIIIRDQAVIEKMLRLTRELDELNGVPAHLQAAAPVQAACEIAEDIETQVRLACDACGAVVMGPDDLDGTACTQCEHGVMTESEASDE